jgi:hypothetical protein
MTTANDELIQEIINILEKRVEGSNPKDLEYEYTDGESLDLVADLLVEAGYTIFGITKDDEEDEDKEEPYCPACGFPRCNGFCL